MAEEGDKPQVIKSFDNMDLHTVDLNPVDRSLEACRRNGIQARELRKLNRDELLKKFQKEPFHDMAFFEEFARHYEEKRLKKIMMCKKTRKEMIETGDVPFDDLNRSHSVQSLKGSSVEKISGTQSVMSPKAGDPGAISMIEREKKMLEKLKERQNRELLRMLEHEQKLDELRQRNMMKEAAQLEKKMQMEAMINKKRREAEEKKFAQEKEKIARAKAEEEANKKRKHELFLQEQEKIRKDQEREIERKRQIRLKEEEEKKKLEEYQRQTEAILKEQEKQAQIRQKIRTEHEIKRKEKFDQQNEQRRIEAELIRKHHELKLLQAKEKNEEMIKKQREEFDKRQQEEAERKRKFDEETERRAQFMRLEAKKKEEEIQRVLKQNELMLDKKKDDYYRRKQHEEQKRKVSNVGREHEEEIRKQRQWQKEKKRLDVLEMNEKLMNDRRTTFNHKFYQSEQKVQHAQKQLHDQLNFKKNVDHLKELDKLENIERMRQIEEYKKMKILSKIEKDNERTAMIRKEQEAMIAMRHKIRREMEAQKEKLMQDYYNKQKKNKSTQGFYKLNSSNPDFALEQTTQEGTFDMPRSDQSHREFGGMNDTREGDTREYNETRENEQ